MRRLSTIVIVCLLVCSGIAVVGVQAAPQKNNNTQKQKNSTSGVFKIHPAQATSGSDFGNDSGNATQINTSSQINGSISSPQDQDWFVFPASGNTVFQINRLDGQGNLTMTFIASNGTQLGNTLIFTENSSSRVMLGDLPSGNYYLAVGSDNGGTGRYLLNYTTGQNASSAPPYPGTSTNSTSSPSTYPGTSTSPPYPGTPSTSTYPSTPSTSTYPSTPTTTSSGGGY